MNSKLLSCFIAGALATTFALASPALARGGGGGMHGGGMGGGHFGGTHGGARFGGGHFAGSHFAHAGFSRFAFHDRRFFHHRFAFGAPFAYAAYDGCWRRVWTSYGLQWVDVCGGYGY